MELTIEVTGVTSLMMHNGQLADPLNPFVREISKFTSKRNKTEEDHETIARLEHRAGLYFDPDVGPFIPGECFFATLLKAGKKYKKGPKVSGGVLVLTAVNPIAYNGPRTTEGLWEDKQFVSREGVKVQTSRVMRTRPIFREWSTSFDVLIDETVWDLDEFLEVVTTAGTLVGLLEKRPRLGRFSYRVFRGGKEVTDNKSCGMVS
jgi:hypothetical protein